MDIRWLRWPAMCGVGWATVMAAVVDYGTPLIEHPDRIEQVAAVGVDETAFLRARPGRSTVFATGIVDLHRGKLIDIIPGRSRKVLADWLIDQPAEWAAGNEVAALDPFRGYGAALSAGRCAAAPSTSPPPAGRAFWSASRPATITARSPPPGSPPRNYAQSIAAATAARPPPASTTGP
jgi:Transposase